ncbi:MAG: anaerobic glycerol-3-phosphate dehydrogenase subunit C [Planctomycetes bacterium]|nr:anaerobic glycerol-3-phosphate dehydrogenase subunit C [Planctomycetota bacterium]
MDTEQQRIEEDLRGQIAGEVRCDDLFVQLFATDASIYEVAPLGVVRPRTVEDVVATVRYAASHNLPLHARGSGSGLAGESLGRGLIVDFSRYMRRVLEIGEQTVRVQAGVVLDDLNRQLASTGRKFGPDPATSHVTTMGGVIALDSAGSHWPAYGSARQHVESLEVVLASGELVQLSTHDVSTAGINSHAAPIPSLLNGVQTILNRYDEFLSSCQPRSLVNRCGYRLDDLRQDHRLSLSRLLTGSEGTLGLITAATLRTSPLPSHVGSVLLFFESLEKAARGSLEVMPLGPSACDMMDRRHLSLARESDPRYELLIPQAAEAVLLVEHQADTAEELSNRLSETVNTLQEKSKLASGAYIADDQYDHEMLWQLARHYVPTLYRLKGSSRPVPIVEDIAVPPAELPGFLHRAQQILKKEHVTASFFGHAGHGQLHIRPFLDLSNQDDVHKMAALTDQLYQDVWQVGGTISGEHGDGLSRTPYVAEQYGPLADAFSEIKELFDPQEILNPGKIVPLESTGEITDNLRRLIFEGTEQTALLSGKTLPVKKVEPALTELQLDWQPAEIMQAARACNGCAACRTLSEESRMCPIYRFAPREEASPRAKANLARGMLTGTLPPDIGLTEAGKAVADLCVHCHMCRLECPANVDIPKLMLEAKAAYVATNGERLHDWLLTRVDTLCAVASRFSRVANWAVGNRVARWLIEKLLGIAQGRKLPRFAPRPFLQQATARRLNRPQRSSAEKVLYFVDTYANYCDSQLAEAFLAVLQHNGVEVYVPESQQQAAMPFITRGVLDPARRMAEQNVALLAEAVRQGYKIVATEPSAVLALTHEYLTLLPGDHDAQLVAENTFEACHYLWRCHQRGKLQLDFSPLTTTLGLHTPCHMKALEVGTPVESLLDLIPGLRVEPLEKGCSGIAGMYGFQRQNYRNSLRAGLPLLTAIRTGAFQAATTTCSTCKIQMEQGTSKPTIHPIKLVALAYGLMPELRSLLDSPSEDLVVS